MEYIYNCIPTAFGYTISLAPDVVIMSQAVNYDLMETELSRLADAGIQVAFVNYHL